mgnify:FL=1
MRSAAALRTLRGDLAAAHRLCSRFGLDELVWNHISARCDDDDDGSSSSSSSSSIDDDATMLVTPGTKLWQDYEPCDFEESSYNVTANVLHNAVYAARPDARALVHCHAPAIEAVSCLRGGVAFLSQTSVPFFNRIAYHDWLGVSTSSEEKASIATSLATQPGARVLMMRNHGAISIGGSVGEAFTLMYYLERVCRVQLNCMQAAEGEVIVPDDLLREQAAGDGQWEWFYNDAVWSALRESALRDGT